LRDWADYAEVVHSSLVLYWGEQKITVDCSQIDVNKDLEILFNKPPQLVTAAAFFDLVSEKWITGFAQQLVRHSTPFYTVLTYDGVERWTPPHPADAAVLAAFHAHQTSDKGFGSAAGPGAFALMEKAFKDRGWRVVAGQSPWRLSAATEAPLIAALADGAAGAVAETGLVPPADVASWLEARRVAQTCEIGHMDVFAALNL
jgi:hypothetical protein